MKINNETTKGMRNFSKYKPEGYHHTLQFEVRDYELDMLGMINNSVYQNYLEHARHKFIKTIGIDFAAMYHEGFRLIVVRSEIDYKHILESGDQFIVKSSLVRVSRARFGFYQDIFKEPEGNVVLEAKIIASCISSTGRPTIPDSLATVIDNLEQTLDQNP